MTRSALYLATGDPDAPALSLVAADAVRVPNAVVVPAQATDSPFGGIHRSASASLGAGRVAVGALEVVAGTTWTPPRPCLHDADTALGRVDELNLLIDAMALPVPEMLGPSVSRLRRGLCACNSLVVEAAAHQLVGRGPGLTPSGDDIMCGVLATCHALAVRDDDVATIGAALAAVAAQGLARTTLVSAVLLRHAARGEVIPELDSLLTALGTGAGLRPSLSKLLAVGHHSGSDLARGVALGLLTGRSHVVHEGSLACPTP